MELKIISNGIFGSNSYIISDNHECAVIDCGVKEKELLSAIKGCECKVRYIILTHGHVDHIFYSDSLLKATDALLCLHEDDKDIYFDADKNGYNLFYFSEELVLPVPQLYLKHGEKLPLGNTHLEIIHTPGHSPGSISVLCENMLISGDTLFQMSVGRTDLTGGSPKQLLESIKTRLYSLDENTVVYPGHGQSTTIAFERENNPYV